MNRHARSALVRAVSAGETTSLAGAARGAKVTGVGLLLLALFLTASLTACGGGAPPVREPDVVADAPPPLRSDDPAPAPSPRREDVRALAPDARFADLLGAARTLDNRRDQESDAGCLLRRGWRLEADLAVAVRPLPTPPDDLDARLRADASPVNVLSRWGAYGSGEPAHPSFAAVTTTLPPRREPAIVWVVTDDGLYVRSSDAPASAPGSLSVEDALARLGPLDAVGALYVTAEAGLSLTRLAEVLARVPEPLEGRVGLAVALEAGTRLPAPPVPAPAEDAASARCPDGLPPPPADAALGSLRPEVIVQSLGPLRDRVGVCVSTADGPGAAGGQVVLALRIGADGRVSEACAVEDDTGDPGLLACLARAARATAFPAPEPAGMLDVALPLRLSPLATQRQRPLCD